MVESFYILNMLETIGKNNIQHRLIFLHLILLIPITVGQ